jgi:hypothetical protein
MKVTLARKCSLGAGRNPQTPFADHFMVIWPRIGPRWAVRAAAYSKPLKSDESGEGYLSSLIRSVPRALNPKGIVEDIST